MTPEAAMQERQEEDVLVVLDPPTRRIYGKSAPGQLLPKSAPFLCPMRKGGECSEVESYEEIEEVENDIEIFELWQHQRLKKLVQEEVADLLAGKPTEGWAQQWVKETGEMEKVMEVKARIKALATPEVLQTRTVPLEEVKKDLEKWRAAFEKEYETLTSGPVEVLDRQQCQRLKDSGSD